VINSAITRQLGLDSVKEAAEYAMGTLTLPVTGNRERYSDATTVLDQINSNRSEVY
jgi:hypothetical protein